MLLIFRKVNIGNINGELKFPQQNYSRWYISFNTAVIKMELCVFALGVSTGMHGRDNENTLHKKEIFFVFPLWKKNLLFLPCNMAVVQNLYFEANPQRRQVFLLNPSSEVQSVLNTGSGNLLPPTI